MYPPLTGQPNSAGVDIMGIPRTTAARVLIEGINGTLDEAFPPLTAKPKAIVASKVGLGKNSYITKVKVGQIIDTMRSRRNKFVENYSELEIR